MVGFNKTHAEPTIPTKFISAGLAASTADIITFPLDTAKVRLQIQGEQIGGHVGLQLSKQLKYRGVFGTILTMAKEEGPKTLYSGLTAGLQRQMCFASVRVGLYDTVKSSYHQILVGSSSSSSGVIVRILAGITTGGAAVLFAQPTDVVKIRMQAQGTSNKSRYSGVINAYKTIFHTEGIKGLWKGTIPNVARNATVTAAELVSYDLIKESILDYHLMTDNIPCHFVSAFGAGFCTTVIASPVDVIKTRLMNSVPGQYSGIIDCASKMFKEGGGKAFYKGFVPSFLRMSSWNICMFVCYEQLKRGFTNLQTQFSVEDAITIGTN